MWSCKCWGHHQQPSLVHNSTECQTGSWAEIEPGSLLKLLTVWTQFMPYNCTYCRMVVIQTRFHHLHTFSSHYPPRHNQTGSCMWPLPQDRTESLLTSDCHWQAPLADHIPCLQILSNIKYFLVNIIKGDLTCDNLLHYQQKTNNQQLITSSHSLVVHIYILSEILRQMKLFYNPLTWWCGETQGLMIDLIKWNECLLILPC